MRNAIAFWAGRPVAVTMILAALLGFGIWAGAALPRERLPRLNVPRVLVEASYPGMAAAEIRSLIALPLEDALASVKGAQSVRSVSRDGLCSVILDFAWGEDPAVCASRAREAIDGAYPALPEGAAKPIALPYEADGTPLAVVSVAAVNGDPSLARRLAEYELRARFRRVEGVSLVTVVGGREREILVSVDPQRAAARGMTVSGLARLLSRESADIPAGTVTEGERELVVVAQGRPASAAALSSLVLRAPSGSFALSDLAQVSERGAPRRSVFVADGEERIALEIRARPNSDRSATAKRIRAEVAAANAAFGSDAEVRVLSDSSLPVSRGISGLLASALLGAAASAAAIAFFLKDARASALVAASIPLSAAASFSILALLGKSLNGMSLGGIALGIGMISDNAVVVVDLLAASLGSACRRPSAEACADQAARVAASTFGGAATTCIVFLPVLFLPGPIGALFSDLAVSLVAAVGAGWLFSLFSLPALYRVFWTPSSAAGRPPRPAPYLRAYRKALSGAFRKPLPVAAVSLGLALGGAALTATRPAGFLTRGAETELEVVASFPPGTSLDRVAREGAVLSAALGESPSTLLAFGAAGAEADAPFRRSSGDYRRELLILRCPLTGGVSAAAAAEDIRVRARSVLRSDVALSVRPPLDPTAAVLGLTGARRIAARGSTPEEASSRAEAARDALLRESGKAVASAETTPSGKRAELRATPKREASAHLGIAVSDVAENARVATEGVVVARLEIEGRGIDVRLSAHSSGEDALSALSCLPVSSRPLPAAAAARIDLGEGRAAFARVERSDAAFVDAVASVQGDKRLEAAIRELCARSPGLSIADESAFRRYSSDLALTVGLTVVLLYLALGAQFESFILPFILLSSSPLALAGAGPALALAGAGLDSGSGVGLIVLFGTAVNNALTLWEHASEKARAGADGAAACFSGAVGRLRPILATTATTVVALVPIVLLSPPSAQKSMAAAMLGGMIASTALSLFAVPLLLFGYLRGRPRQGEAR